MSTMLAIAAVSAVLKDLLNNGLIDHDLPAAVGSVSISTRAPDLVPLGADDPATLMLFLYRVSENQGWRNAGMPTRNDRGDRLSNPPLALDLHYLLAAHGAQEFQAEILLGYAMHLLHENPVLSRDAIRRALSLPSPVAGGVLPPAFGALTAADLADQVESLRVTPEPLGIDELSKLWPAFQANYRVSAGYQVSVVLIEGQRSTKAALPVRRPRLYVLPTMRPQIATVAPDVPPAADQRLTASSTLLLQGSDLRGQVTQVRVGEALATPAVADTSNSQIRLALAGLAGLRAGATGAQVVHQVLMGEPEPGVAHEGTESNVVAFVLHPALDGAATVAGASTSSENGETLVAATLNVPIMPRVGRNQRVVLLLNERNPPDTRPARAYSFAAPPFNGIGDANQPDTASIGFVLRRVIAGAYLVRVVVDGAESALQSGGDGRYNGPQVNLP